MIESIRAALRRAGVRPAAAALLLSMAAPAAAEPGPPVRLQPGGTEKVCQVLGEFDRQKGQPTVNLTASRFRFWGGDLGASVEHEGRLYFLFGDTHPVPHTVWRERDADSIAVSETTDPEHCVHLTFLMDSDGGYRQLKIPGIFQGAFAVPSGGLSLNGNLYVWHTSDVPDRGFSARSVLARSDNDGYSFDYLFDLSRETLVHVSPALVPEGSMPELPPHEGDGVLLFGTGLFRGSDAYLGFMPADGIENPNTLRHFAGLDGGGKPVWTADESESAPLFRHGCMGEFSAAWNPFVEKWVMLYTCGGARAHTFLRTADQPWGPWSEAEMLFDPAWDIAGCEFLHIAPPPDVVAAGGEPCPVVTDPHTPFNLGEAYGPYLIDRFTTGEKGKSSTIYFLMSTWNPYTVVLMKATLVVDGRGDVGAAWPAGPKHDRLLP
ncbi:MAG TPA: DUF4185 domain-containing protein [Mesorhizobium sp.]|nr:DUF4185 domain-containing protein [Mesorhizobium sp.]